MTVERNEILIDTNLLIRSANQADPLHLVARNAIAKLRTQGESLYIVPQCLYEFYTVATRPTTARGGLGYSPSRAKTELDRLQTLFIFLPDTSEIFNQWALLVSQYNVSGVQTHDARLVAAMRVHNLPTLLTFNTADFTRYDQITVLDPAAI